MELNGIEKEGGEKEDLNKESSESGGDDFTECEDREEYYFNNGDVYQG